MALMIMLIALGIGGALLATAVGQERAAGNQQSSESAYSLAEAALNAQIFELSQQWPTITDAAPGSTAPNYGYPTSCNAASNGASYCPTPGDLAGYTLGSQTCPAGTPGDAWNSGAPVTNGWTTYVRDAGVAYPPSSTYTLFSSLAEKTAAPFNSSVATTTTTLSKSGSGSVWVRAVGIVNCHIAVLVTRVDDQIGNLPFPDDVLDANSFSTGNSGAKTIINVQDANGNVGPISLRCTGPANGNGAQPPNGTCAGVGKATQIQPTPQYAAPAPSPALDPSELKAFQRLATQNGTNYSGCPNFTNAAQLTGEAVYIQGGPTCAITITKNDAANAPPLAPGLLVIADGTISFTGSATFYGVIYGENQSGSTANIVTLGGTSTVVGGINVDGNASLDLGSSGNGVVPCTDTSTSQKCGDLEYSRDAFGYLFGFDGAVSAPNMFRQLPNNQ
jgi:hypothetical protein